MQKEDAVARLASPMLVSGYFDALARTDELVDVLESSGLLEPGMAYAAMVLSMYLDRALTSQTQPPFPGKWVLTWQADHRVLRETSAEEV